MKKNSLFIIIVIYIFLYCLNYLTPLAFGDDYLYSFIWTGQPMNVPISENAVRVTSFSDLIHSQWIHYQTWGGRTIAHLIAQFFLWIGKNVFNFANAFIATFLILEIYWCVNRGEITFSFRNPQSIFWIFFALWAFTPGFSPVFLWLTGACNYLWTSVLLIGFLLPYIKKYYFAETQSVSYRSFAIVFFFFGIIAGWTNENSVCFVILVLIVFLYCGQKTCLQETWMVTGLIGLVIGYVLLLIAPGNFVRLQVIHGLEWRTEMLLFNNLKTLLQVLFYQVFLWYFILKALFFLKWEQNKIMQRDIKLVKVLCIIAFGSTVIMTFSPEYPGRSGFPATIWLIVATGILFRVHKEHSIILLNESAKTFLIGVGLFYFVMTSIFTFRNYYERYQQIQTLLSTVQQKKSDSIENSSLITVELFGESSEIEYLLSGFHIIHNELTNDENSWENISFSRYYGIKGIRGKNVKSKLHK